MMKNHTELPLKISDLNNPANTEYVLIAANNHYELLSALKNLVGNCNGPARCIADANDAIKSVEDSHDKATSSTINTEPN